MADHEGHPEAEHPDHGQVTDRSSEAPKLSGIDEGFTAMAEEGTGSHLGVSSECPPNSNAQNDRVHVPRENQPSDHSLADARVTVPSTASTVIGPMGNMQVDEACWIDNTPSVAASPKTPTRGHTDPRYVVFPDYPRVSYSLSPETGLAEIIEESRPPIKHDTPSTVASPSLVRSAVGQSLPGTPGAQDQMEVDFEDKHSPAKTPKIRALALKHIRGPTSALPAHLRETIEQWHEKNPREKPEWALRISLSTIRNWDNFKVFSRNGEECDLSVFQIFVTAPAGTKSFSYAVMILHSEGCRDQFVGISMRRPGIGKAKGNSQMKHVTGSYLIVWDETEDRWEGEIAAVRLSYAKSAESTEQKLLFWPSIFDNSTGFIEPYRLKREKRDFTGDVEKELMSPPPIRPRKQRRVLIDDAGSPNPTLTFEGVQRRLDFNPEVRVKFSTADTVRYFPLDGCNVSVLFKKERQFYAVMKSPMDTESGLSCKINGLEEARFIGENCGDEWDILCKDIWKLTISDDGPHLLEVQPAGVQQANEEK